MMYLEWVYNFQISKVVIARCFHILAGGVGDLELHNQSLSEYGPHNVEFWQKIDEMNMFKCTNNMDCCTLQYRFPGVPHEGIRSGSGSKVRMKLNNTTSSIIGDGCINKYAYDKTVVKLVFLFFKVRSRD